jgi:hypothetical protein
MNAATVKIEALSDCFHLMEVIAEISDSFKEAVRQERHFALMADAAQPGERTAAELLSYCREAANSESPDDRLAAKLALALGLRALQGIESDDPSPWQEEAGRYGAAFLYRLYYIKGEAPGADAVSSVFRALRQRNTIELHTFVANTSSVDAWIEQLYSWEQTAGDELRQFAETVARPELLTAAYEIGGTPFYSSGDALLPLLVQLRSGQSVEAQAIRSALDETPSSVYGRMVRNGFKQLLSVQSDFRETAV